MERHTCKLCFRRFSNGRALGGHMRSHVTGSVTIKQPRQHPLLQDSTFLTSSSSSGAGEAEQVTAAEEEEVEEKFKVAGAGAAGGYYGLRENPRKSFKFSDPEFSALDYTSFFFTSNNNSASVVLQDRESETESSSLPPPPSCSSFRRRSKRRRRHSPISSPVAVVELEPVSSVSDTTPDEDVALCLMMLSRDIWSKETKFPKQLQEDDDDVDEEEELKDYLSSSNSEQERRRLKKTSGGRTRFQCGTCKKVFRSYQALGGHRASHKKVKSCAGAGAGEIREEEEEVNVAVAADPRIHECPFCFRVFSSGQALGGHKRSHLVSSVHRPPASTSAGVKNDDSRIKIGDSFLDLNLPAPTEEEEAEVEFSAVSDAA